MCISKPLFTPLYRASHAHYFEVQTSITLSHSHRVQIFTYPNNGDGSDGHTHNFQGTSKLSNQQADIRHFHRMNTRTGPAIPLPDGSHYHEILDETNDEPFILPYGNYYETIFTIERHTHVLKGATSPPVGIAPPHW